MATTLVESAFLDTNVLLEATATSRVLHDHALRVLNEWPARGTTLYVSGQIVREYLVVATRPPAANGLGLDLPAALCNVAAFRARTRLLSEGPRVVTQLTSLLEEVSCVGKTIHDANLVATVLRHRTAALVTANATDFRRFGERLRVIELSSC